VRSIPGIPPKEGLEQDFNSLHAQREACEAYIRSQQEKAGACARPRIMTAVFPARRWSVQRSKQLLADIRGGVLVDVVVGL